MLAPTGADIGAEIAECCGCAAPGSGPCRRARAPPPVSVARLVVAEERFRAGRHPVHRPAELLRRRPAAPGIPDRRRSSGRRRRRHRRSARAAAPSALHDGDELVAQRARALRADTQRVAVGCRVVARGGAARLHRGDRRSAGWSRRCARRIWRRRRSRRPRRALASGSARGPASRSRDCPAPPARAAARPGRAPRGASVTGVSGS